MFVFTSNANLGAGWKWQSHPKSGRHASLLAKILVLETHIQIVRILDVRQDTWTILKR